MKNNQKSSNKFYFDNPQLWHDLRLHSLEKEVDLLDHFLSMAPGKKVLDIGCGVGAHCDALRKRDYEPLGIDLKSSMIKFANNKYPKCQFIQGDMKNLNKTIKKSNKFDALLCLCTTFTYNLTNKQVNNALESFNSLINTNGLLIIEVFNPISFLEKNRFNGSFFLEDNLAFEKLGFKVKIKQSVDEVRQIIREVKTFTNIQSNKVERKDISKYRLFFPQELTYIVESAGFKKIGLYGRYDLNYKKLDKTRLIIVAQKL